VDGVPVGVTEPRYGDEAIVGKSAEREERQQDAERDFLGAEAAADIGAPQSGARDGYPNSVSFKSIGREIYNLEIVQSATEMG
jgi:hypothetical protein